MKKSIYIKPDTRTSSLNMDNLLTINITSIQSNSDATYGGSGTEPARVKRGRRMQEEDAELEEALEQMASENESNLW